MMMPTMDPDPLPGHSQIAAILIRDGIIGDSCQQADYISDDCNSDQISNDINRTDQCSAAWLWSGQVDYISTTT